MSAPKGPPWPEHKLELLRAFEAEGMSLRAMALAFGCAVSTLKRQREYLGLSRPSPIIRTEKPNGRGYQRKRVRAGASTLAPLASLTEDQK